VSQTDDHGRRKSCNPLQASSFQVRGLPRAKRASTLIPISGLPRLQKSPPTAYLRLHLHHDLVLHRKCAPLFRRNLKFQLEIAPPSRPVVKSSISYSKRMAYCFAAPARSLTLSNKSIPFSCVNLIGSNLWWSSDSVCRAVRLQRTSTDSPARSPPRKWIEGAWAGLARPAPVMSRLGR
jgi:hypothetical protein